MHKPSANMILNRIIQHTDPQPGDYYGTIYKGSLIIPLLVIGAIVAVVLWWFFRKRRG